jgi:[ribosomal protein S5]-alanine N-acetyltransferase
VKIPLILKHCTIRAWRSEDNESLAHHANNREVWLTLRDLFPHPYTIADADAFISQAMAEEPATKFCIDIDGVAVGGIGIRLGTDVHRYTAELGYWIGREFWSRGVMTEAVAAFTDWAFVTFNLHRVFAQSFSTNPASARVLEKAGFVFEGRLKKSVFKAEQLIDSLLYAKTR